VYPDTVAPVIEKLNTVERDGFAELKVSMVLHSGTHIDAPSHIIQGAKSLDQFPVDKFIGSAIVIPCTDRSEITLDLLSSYESQIAEVDFVLFYTGWQHKWSTPAYLESSPVPTEASALWLTQFNLKGIGVDSFSIDRVISANDVAPETLPNHQILLGRDILLIENLANLDKLPAGPFQFQCLPIHIEHADGSPVRAVALVGSPERSPS